MKIFALTILLSWTSLAAAATENISVGGRTSVDLRQVQVFSTLLFADSKTAMVGIYQAATGLAGFADCQLTNVGFEGCTFDQSTQFTFNQDSMDFLTLALPLNLPMPGPGAEQMGFNAGFLRSLGLSSGSVGVLFGIQELETQGSALSPHLQNYYGRLFQTDLNSPPTLDFDSAGGSVTAEDLRQAISLSIQNLKP